MVQIKLILLSSENPFDDLYRLANGKSRNRDYYRKQDVHVNAPRSPTICKAVDDAARASVKKIEYKIDKDLNHYKSLTVRGHYVCVNRFAESVFGIFKKAEQDKASATTETVIQLTIARKKNLEFYLDNLSDSKIKSLCQKIDGKKALQNYRLARIATQLKLQEFAAKRRESIAKEKAEKQLNVVTC
ncbi:Oidioi.mRNA.OKI2018_I69.YSR.g17120.t1.cds [Oikopleura dioica]|uniref:Oidioi.mRNA.OKI2018_I69.YSR.g17120.t1.cds n=1 Tax=Oikopleura dioica TaxID=34765 RepID=A0ABN7SLZ8_OIKDI|nr:Oidioi.mRNA.OKI2018_I69.YSR.g17120.t1.cds [Oikopleura dioica]